MTSNSYIITDPVGYQIYLPEALCVQGEGEKNEHTGFRHVLETPACIIELPNRQRCYFRSLAWNMTILISVVYGDHQWTATSFLRNPGPDYIQQLLREGTFVACSSLD